MKKIFHIKKDSLKPYMPDYEANIYYRIRLSIITLGSLIFLSTGIYGLVFHESVGLVSRKFLIYFSGLSFIGVYILAMMVRPGTKDFWIIFLLLLPIGYMSIPIIVAILFVLILFQFAKLKKDSRNRNGTKPNLDQLKKVHLKRRKRNGFKYNNNKPRTVRR